ncbi:hypothetical protein TNCV_2031211 [Trichonephila clavipes]|nr:hypothetical protein TNCV_2031211 [Trichonephila clavipes]
MPVKGAWIGCGKCHVVFFKVLMWLRSATSTRNPLFLTQTLVGQVHGLAADVSSLEFKSTSPVRRHALFRVDQGGC